MTLQCVRMSGEVKWFNGSLGFFKPDSGDADVRLSSQALLDFPGVQVLPGARVSALTYHMPDRGLRAQRVLEIDLTTARVPSAWAPHAMPLSDDWRPGEIKWFNLRNGYGFVVEDEAPEDTFLHMEAAKASRVQGEALKPGRRVLVRPGQWRKGRMAIAIKLAEHGGAEHA